MAQGKLPFSQKAQIAVQEITLLEKNDDWQLHGKTGTSLRTNKQVGWWVGWVKKGEKIYCFAFNMEINPKASNKWLNPFNPIQRINFGKEILKVLNLIN